MYGVIREWMDECCIATRCALQKKECIFLLVAKKEERIWERRRKREKDEKKKEGVERRWEVGKEGVRSWPYKHDRSLSRLPCSMTALANCLKTRSMYVLCRGHRPSRKPIWPPWQVMRRARLGFCFTISTGMAVQNTKLLLEMLISSSNSLLLS